MCDKRVSSLGNTTNQGSHYPGLAAADVGEASAGSVPYAGAELGRGIVGADSERLSPVAETNQASSPPLSRALQRERAVRVRIEQKIIERRAIEQDIRELRQLLGMAHRFGQLDELVDLINLSAKHGV